MQKLLEKKVHNLVNLSPLTLEKLLQLQQKTKNE